MPIHYDLSHHNLCMTEHMVHKRKPRHNNTSKQPNQENTNQTQTQHPQPKKTIASTEVKRESETVLTRSVFLLRHIVQYRLISNTQSYMPRHVSSGDNHCPNISLSIAKKISMYRTATGRQTLPVSHHWQPMGPRPQRGRGILLLVVHTARIGDIDENPECSIVE